MEENKVRGPDLEKYLEGRHHNYITYAQGARFYNLPYWTFVNLAKKAKATWALRKTAIVYTVVLDRYLQETLRLAVEQRKESERELMKKRKDIENLEGLVFEGHKKYVRWDEGAKLYSMGLHTFQKYAKDAGACYKIGKIILVNTEIFEEFIEAFKLED